MPRSYEEVLQIAYTLPEDQRLLLANSLLESAAFGESTLDGAGVAAAWNEEIKRRLDDIDSGTADLIPGEKVRADLIARLSPQTRARLRL